MGRVFSGPTSSSAYRADAEYDARRVGEMISRKTVLILGAGASSDYGFPTGAELINKILEASKDDNGEIPICLRNAGAKANDLRELIKALGETQLNSIDSLLEHRSELREVGKLAIAAALIPCESPKRLNPPGQHWYRKLFNTLVGDPSNVFDGSRLTIITLNYDRSLEEYLFQTVKREFSLTTDDAARRVQGIKFIHFHGDLGILPWWIVGDNAPEPHHYSPSLTPERVKAAAGEIRVVSEFEHHDNSRHLLMRVRSELESAEVVGFLGFGYHYAVMERMGLVEVCGKKDSLQMFGSACRVPRGRRDELSSMFSGMVVGDPDHTVSEFIDDCTLLFQAGAAGGVGSRRWASLQARRHIQ